MLQQLQVVSSQTRGNQMWKYRKYIIQFRNNEYDGKIAQRIGKFVYVDAKRIDLLSKIGVTIKVEMS